MKIERGATLSVKAFGRIRDDIAEGRFAPGARLIERDLCGVLGVSRTVVREALRLLQAQGYVVATPRGPIVAPLDAEAIRSIYEVREALETLAAELFVQRATDGDRARVTALMERLLGFADSDDHAAGLAVLNEFLDAFAVGSGNPLIAPILAPLTGRIHMLQSQAAQSRARRPQALAGLKALAEALVGADPAAASDAARRRLRQAARFALACHAQQQREGLVDD